ncbi:hypothetical protein LCGC14_1752750, partial [marine sediment metagenome]
MGGVFRLDDLLRQEDEPFKLTDLLGKPKPPTLKAIAGPLVQPMARDATAVQLREKPHPEIGPIPEAGGLKKFLTAAGTTARVRGLMDQRPIQTPERQRERMAERAELGTLTIEEGDLEVDLTTQLGEMLGSLADPTIIAPFIAGEKMAFRGIEMLAKRGLPLAKKFLGLATAPETAGIAQRSLSNAVRAFGTAGTGALAAETVQKVGREGELPTPGEAGMAFAVGTLAIPPIAAAFGGLGAALGRIKLPTSRFPRDIARAADLVREKLRTEGPLTAAEELEFARKVVGVGRDATDDQIGQAFRQRARPFHEAGETPDEETFKIFSEAVAILRRAAPRQETQPQIAPPVTDTKAAPRTVEAFEEELARDLRAVEKPPLVNRRPEVSVADRRRLNLPGEERFSLDDLLRTKPKQLTEGVPEKPPQVSDIPPRVEAPTEGIAPQEPTPVLPKIASLNKAEGAAIRERLGLEELPPVVRQSFQSAWDEAKGRNLAEQATDVAQEAAASRRPLTPTEHAGAVQRYLELERDLTEVRSALADAVRQNNDQITQQLSVRSQRILDEIDALTEATDRTGSEAGRALSIRRLRANVETFTLASGLQMARSRKGGSLAPQEIGKIEELTGRISALEEQNTKLRTENDELEQKRLQAIAEQVVRVEA